MENSLIDIIRAHGFECIALDGGAVRVVGVSWVPQTGEHIDEILRKDSDGTLYSVEVLTGSDKKVGEFEYANIRHFLGY